jgi:hypothetical protein
MDLRDLISLPSSPMVGRFLRFYSLVVLLSFFHHFILSPFIKGGL